MDKAVILLSGGLDSTTTLAIAMEQGLECHCLSFDYGQRHSVELDRARQIAKRMGAASHRIMKLDLGLFGGSALTDMSLEVPVERDESRISSEIPVTYVPARNMILLSIAVGLAEIIGASSVFIGANSIDYSGYPDCRPEFLEAFQRATTLGTRVGVEAEGITIEYPLISMTKARIITEGTRLGVPYELTWSCYNGGKKACGKCDSCILRLRGFKEAGLRDPVEYEGGQ